MASPLGPLLDELLAHAADIAAALAATDSPAVQAMFTMPGEQWLGVRSVPQLDHPFMMGVDQDAQAILVQFASRPGATEMGVRAAIAAAVPDGGQQPTRTPFILAQAPPI